MPVMTNSKTVYIDMLTKTIAIQNKIIDESQELPTETKNAFVTLGNYWLKRIQTEPFTLTQLKSIAHDILTYWHESIGIDTELFWAEVQQNNIDFDRKDEFIFALNKGRFRRVDIGIGARKYWPIIQHYDAVKNRFTREQIEKIDSIIEADNNTRLALLTKCLHKKAIPQSQYLKFGECMAYFNNGNLFHAHFSKEQVAELYNIWKQN